MIRNGDILWGHDGGYNAVILPSPDSDQTEDGNQSIETIKAIILPPFQPFYSNRLWTWIDGSTPRFAAGLCSGRGKNTCNHIRVYPSDFASVEEMREALFCILYETETEGRQSYERSGIFYPLSSNGDIYRSLTKSEDEEKKAEILEKEKENVYKEMTDSSSSLPLPRDVRETLFPQGGDSADSLAGLICACLHNKSIESFTILPMRQDWEDGYDRFCQVLMSMILLCTPGGLWPYLSFQTYPKTDGMRVERNKCALVFQPPATDYEALKGYAKRYDFTNERPPDWDKLGYMACLSDMLICSARDLLQGKLPNFQWCKDLDEEALKAGGAFAETKERIKEYVRKWNASHAAGMDGLDYRRLRNLNIQLHYGFESEDNVRKIIKNSLNTLSFTQALGNIICKDPSLPEKGRDVESAKDITDSVSHFLKNYSKVLKYADSQTLPKDCSEKILEAVAIDHVAPDDRSALETLNSLRKTMDSPPPEWAFLNNAALQACKKRLDDVHENYVRDSIDELVTQYNKVLAKANFQTESQKTFEDFQKIWKRAKDRDVQPAFFSEVDNLTAEWLQNYFASESMTEESLKIFEAIFRPVINSNQKGKLNGELSKSREALSERKNQLNHMRDFWDFFSLKTQYPSEELEERLWKNLKKDRYVNADFRDFVLYSTTYVKSSVEGEIAQKALAESCRDTLLIWSSDDRAKKGAVRDRVIGFNLDKKEFHSGKKAWASLYDGLGRHESILKEQTKVLVRYGWHFGKGEWLDRAALLALARLELKDAQASGEYDEELKKAEKTLRKAGILKKRFAKGKPQGNRTNSLKRFLLPILGVVAAVAILAGFCIWKYSGREQLHTVTLMDSDGGNLSDFAENWRIANADSIPADVPKKPGYTFVGWRLGGKKYDSQAVTSDITLVAEWEEQVFTIAFYCGDDYPSESPEPINVSVTRKAELPTPEWEGHDFLYWTLDGTTPYSPDQTLTEDITLYALWRESAPNPETGATDANTRTVIFRYDTAKRGDDERIVKTEVSVPYGEPVDVESVPQPERQGCIFEGWYRDNQPFLPESPVVEDMTLTARWKDGCIVTFINPSAGQSETKTVEIGTPAHNTKEFCQNQEGFKEVVWQKDYLDYNPEVEIVSEDITLYAYWVPKNQESRTVTFEVKDKEENIVQSYKQTVRDGEVAQKPIIPLNDGVMLTEWRIEEENVSYDFARPVISDVTLTAVQRERTHTVTFVMKKFSNISGVKDEHKTVKDGEALIDSDYPTNFIKSRHNVDGWYYDSAFQRPYNSEPITEDISLYPHLVPVDYESPSSQGFLSFLSNLFPL